MVLWQVNLGFIGASYALPKLSNFARIKGIKITVLYHTLFKLYSNPNQLFYHCSIVLLKIFNFYIYTILI